MFVSAFFFWYFKHFPGKPALKMFNTFLTNILNSYLGELVEDLDVDNLGQGFSHFFPFILIIFFKIFFLLSRNNLSEICFQVWEHSMGTSCSST